MKNRTKLMSILSVVILLTTSSFIVSSDWTPLLDKDLSQWSKYLSYKYTINYKGEIPKDKNGEVLKPIGYNKDADHVFSVIEEKGEPVLKVSGEIYGCIFTKEEFSNYHLKLKFKWGAKKWEPRMNKLKDSGILYHSIGECGVDYWRSWMLSQEFQIMEGHVGDYWSVASSAVEIRALIPEDIMNVVANERQPFISIGSGTGLDGFCLRSADYESATGQWTEVELICFEDKSIHIVNGHVVMILKNTHYVEDGKSLPLTKGKIQIQSEAAEVYYKDIQIKNLHELPEVYAGYFN